MRKIVIISGPTGVGKTEISLQVAETLQGEIVSCDSMQIYKGMDIGSAKATREEMERVPHHLIDVVSPFDAFTVSDYKDLAEAVIHDIHKRGKPAILVGGTGLYIDAVIKNLSFTEGGSDAVLRKELEEEAKEHGPLFLHEKLKKVDLEAATAIHPNNVKRVVRALEVYHLTGKPFSSFRDERGLRKEYEIHYFYLNKDRKKLYEDIDERVEVMMKRGLLEEVEHLQKSGLNSSYISMQGIGYKEILSYLDGVLSLEGAVDLVKMRSRNYAKRQLTWFRNEKYAEELSKEQYSDEEIIQILEKSIRE